MMDVILFSVKKIWKICFMIQNCMIIGILLLIRYLIKCFRNFVIVEFQNISNRYILSALNLLFPSTDTSIYKKSPKNLIRRILSYIRKNPSCLDNILQEYYDKKTQSLNNFYGSIGLDWNNTLYNNKLFSAFSQNLSCKGISNGALLKYLITLNKIT